MKLWDKGYNINKLVEQFTIGNDRELDMYLAEFDVIGSIAHAKMLNKVGILSDEEFQMLHSELVKVHNNVLNNQFAIEEGIEDVHSQVETILTKNIGDPGKKIHTARSRNDQVLLDIKLYSRHQIKLIVQQITRLFDILIQKSEEYKNVLLPGYTHLQVAMPSSFGLWFGAYAESLVDDVRLLNCAFDVVNQNPLGSAAGYGSSFPIDRSYTTELLGFDSMNVNVVYAQMGRGKAEKTVAFALASIAATLSKMAMDACLYNSQNFNFIQLPKEFTTGSSIMPHKKNPDVFELIRAKSNKIQSLPYELTLITNNLPSGYFRDLQILKEAYIPAFGNILQCIELSTLIIKEIKVNNSILTDNPLYDYLYSVEDVNKEVQAGLSFRDAYKKVGMQIEDGKYKPGKEINHTHEGSIGNLSNHLIKEKFDEALRKFPFSKIDESIKKLLTI